MITPSVEFYTAYLGIQTDLDSLKKNRSGRFKYADLDYLMENLRPILHKHHMIVVPSQTIINETALLVTCLIHATSGQGIESKVPLRGFDPHEYDDQMAGKNITYQRRYMLMTLLNITLEDDVADDNGHAMNAKKEYVRSSNSPAIGYEPAQRLRALINSYQNGVQIEKNIIAFNKVSSIDQLREDQLSRVLNYIKENGTKQSAIGE